MSDKAYDKQQLTLMLDNILNKTLAEIDTKGLFDRVQEFNLQKGVVGTLIEVCVLGYDPNSEQAADLIVSDNGREYPTELKSTGLVIKRDPRPHFAAKEPMSITAVGIYDIAEQKFETSHFWNKLEHLLLVYYHYESDKPVSPYGNF